MSSAPLRLLAEGVSTELCDPVALLTLRRIGLVAGSRLTPAAEEMLLAAVDDRQNRTGYVAGRRTDGFE